MDAEKYRHKNLFWSGNRDGRDRDVFPLPAVQEEPVTHFSSLTFCRKSKKRLRQRLETNSSLNDLTRAVNCLAAGGVRCSSGTLASRTQSSIHCIDEAPLAGQRVVLGNLLDARKEDPPPPQPLDPQRALRELLKESSGGYSLTTRGGLAPYKSGCVSLPTKAPKAIHLVDLLPPAWRDALTAENLLLPEAEAQEARDELGVDAYFDEVLRGDMDLYAEYFADLTVAGMVRWDLQPKDRLAPFFVFKEEDGDSLRALFDARPPNTKFRDPPKTRLLTAEGLAKLEVELADVLLASGYDLRNYYHFLLVPEWMAELFGLPECDLSRIQYHLNLKGSGIEIPMKYADSKGRISGCIQSLPMGFSWAVFLAQLVHEHLVKGAVPELPIMSDHVAITTPHSTLLAGETSKAIVYIDDGGCIGIDKLQIDNHTAAIIGAIESVGLESHAGKYHSAQPNWVKIGVTVDGCRGVLRGKASRRWRLDVGTRGLLMRPKVRSSEVAHIVGHYNQYFLVRRCLLSCFHYVYEFIQNDTGTRRVLPFEVREELQLARMLLPLAFSHLKAPYSGVFYTTDSSETHYCVCRASAPLDLVKSTYRFEEKWRFRDVQVETISRHPNQPFQDVQDIPLQGTSGKETSLNVLCRQLGVREGTFGNRPSVSSGFGYGLGPDYADYYSKFRKFSGEPDRRCLEICGDFGVWQRALSPGGWAGRTITTLSLLDDVEFESIVQDVANGKFGTIVVAAPFSSFSQSRSPPMRNRSHIDGLGGLPVQLAKMVQKDNEMLRRCLVLLNCASGCGVPITWIHYAGSLIWSHFGVRQWMSNWSANVIDSWVFLYGLSFCVHNVVFAQQMLCTLHKYLCTCALDLCKNNHAGPQNPEAPTIFVCRCFIDSVFFFSLKI